MSDNNTYTIIVFILGLFFIGVGIYLFTYDQIVFVSPTGSVFTSWPYSSIGTWMIIIGILLVVGALLSLFRAVAGVLSYLRDAFHTPDSPERARYD
jgi:TRAP-type C4-dicarboxylate transport system permease small subunit